ncbi:hypothetical protein GCM10009611_23790 [Arthrobacter roseus]
MVLTSVAEPAYAGWMTQTPKNYRDYLDDAAPEVAKVVEPVLKQSVADGEHGVLVTLFPEEAHAQVSPEVPFGQIHVEQR